MPWTGPVPVVARGVYGGLKDPCVTFDGETWHLFATGCHEGYRYDMAHATAPDPRGPWTMREPAWLDPALTGPAVCAPGVVADGRTLHMFVQDTYNILGGTIRHLVSDDGGASFELRDVALRSLPGGDEAGLYDAHPAEVHGEKLLVYSAFAVVGSPDIHLARSESGTWDGPWERLGPILCHEHVDCHNQRDHDDYEWGLEGAQLVELPDGRVLLDAVCFLPGLDVGTRQRVFFAVADAATGPYSVLGPALDPRGYAARGENGHGAAVVHDGTLHLFFQHRDGEGLPWEILRAEARAAAVPYATEEDALAS